MRRLWVLISLAGENRRFSAAMNEEKRLLQAIICLSNNFLGCERKYLEVYKSSGGFSLSRNFSHRKFSMRVNKIEAIKCIKGRSSLLL